MAPLFETVRDLASQAELLRRRRYGVIEAVEGQFHQIHLRPFPKIATVPGIRLFGETFHQRRGGDRIWLYYNQPLGCSNYLVLKYVVSTRQGSFGSLCRVLDVLDEIARLKRSDAVLCDVANWRISRRLLARRGWEPHCPSRWHRHYIKRFYGSYPPQAAWIAGNACLVGG